MINNVLTMVLTWISEKDCRKASAPNAPFKSLSNTIILPGADNMRNVEVCIPPFAKPRIMKMGKHVPYDKNLQHLGLNSWLSQTYCMWIPTWFYSSAQTPLLYGFTVTQTSLKTTIALSIMGQKIFGNKPPATFVNAPSVESFKKRLVPVLGSLNLPSTYRHLTFLDENQLPMLPRFCHSRFNLLFLFNQVIWHAQCKHSSQRS